MMRHGPCLTRLASERSSLAYENPSQAHASSLWQVSRTHEAFPLLDDLTVMGEDS